MILLFRGIRILRDSEKTFGGLVAVGLSFSLVFQALINMAVAVSLFPVTGQPLPLVSMGGTSIWFTCIAIGIILSVSRANEDSTAMRLPVRRKNGTPAQRQLSIKKRSATKLSVADVAATPGSSR